MARVQFNAQIKRWRFDPGGEFKGTELTNDLKDLGIQIEMSAPHVHQQNGRAEHAIQTIMEKAQALCFTACLPQSWWEFCVEHAATLLNVTPIKRLNWRSPYQDLRNEKPDISGLRVFGCGAYVYLPTEKGPISWRHGQN